MPMAYLLLVPALVVGISLGCFASVLPSVVASVGQPCSSESGVFQGLICFFTVFFRQCLAPKLGEAFIAAFLAFISALITVSNLESSRIFNQSSRVITNPAAAWLLVNAATGAVITPIVFGFTMKRNKDALAEAEQRRRRSPDESNVSTESPALVLSHDERHLSYRAETYAIAVGVTLGFVLPSIILLITPNPIVVGLWNLFPIFVSLLRRSTLYVLLRSGRHMDKTHHAETSYGSVLRLYAIPAILSVISHWYLIYVFAFEDHMELSASPALKLMVINFWSIVICMAYWIFIETSWRVLAIVLCCSLLGGAGMGLCLGWVLKELCLSTAASGLQAESDSEPLLANHDD
jgi:hypothetical protein